MKVVGYGICGPGEASRYMRETMEEFKRLCDVVVILCNNAGPQEKALIHEYGFAMAEDSREWGKMQWKIKQDFLQREVSKYVEHGDMVVCLDMDETLDRRLTKDWLMQAEMDAYHVFVVDLWNDPEHYKPESCFWNVRLFKWNGNIEFTKKPLHCGLSPEWSRAYNRYAPFLLLHKGLMDPEDRKRKIERYEKYDPNAQYLGKQYYWMIRQDTAEPFDEAALGAKISEEVATYKQSRPRGPSLYMNKQAERYAYFQNSAGITVDVPEKHVELTMKQPGMTFIGWADDAAAEIEDLFAGDDDAIVEDANTLDDSDSLHENDLREDNPESQKHPQEPKEPVATTRNRVGVEKQTRPATRAPAKRK